MRALIGWIRLKLEADRMWCRYCRRSPRELLDDGDNRYCSEGCQEADFEDQSIR